MKYRKSLPKKKKKRERKITFYIVVKYFSPLYQFLLFLLPFPITFFIVKRREREREKIPTRKNRTSKLP